MPCLRCGSRLSGGSSLCEKCIRRVEDPLVFLPRILDPVSERRLSKQSSSILKIGPVADSEVILSKGLQPALRLIESQETKEGLDTMIDLHLSMMGIGTRLRGDEGPPMREVTIQMIRRLEDMEITTDAGARACARAGNLLAAVVNRVSRLPIEESGKEWYCEQISDRAKQLYSKCDPFPAVRWTALANEGLLDHWSGESEDALSLLDYVLQHEIPTADRTEALIKKAVVMRDRDRREDLRQTLSQIPAGVKDDRIESINRFLEERP